MRAECLHVRDAIIVGVVQPDGLAGVAGWVAEEVVVRHDLHGGLGCGEDGVGKIAGVLQRGHDVSLKIPRDGGRNTTHGNMVHAEVEPQNTIQKGKGQNGTKRGREEGDERTCLPDQGTLRRRTCQTRRF